MLVVGGLVISKYVSLEVSYNKFEYIHKMQAGLFEISNIVLLHQRKLDCLVSNFYNLSNITDSKKNLNSRILLLLAPTKNKILKSCEEIPKEKDSWK